MTSSPVSGEDSVLLHLRGPWRPHLCAWRLPPPAAPPRPRSPTLAALRLGRPGLRLGACLQPLHGEAPGSPGRLSGSRNSWPQACPSRPGGLTVLFTCDPSPSPTIIEIRLLHFCDKVDLYFVALFSKVSSGENLI